jgi:hypothetical protein
LRCLRVELREAREFRFRESFDRERLRTKLIRKNRARCAHAPEVSSSLPRTLEIFFQEIIGHASGAPAGKLKAE